jgi:uncharacterized paraquat-inducible protein A
MALAVAALILLSVMCLTTLMTVRTSGIMHQAGIFSGPVELGRRGMSGLAMVVVFVTIVAPLAKLLGTIYVLLRIREAARHGICGAYSHGSNGSRPGQWSKSSCSVSSLPM